MAQQGDREESLSREVDLTTEEDLKEASTVEVHKVEDHSTKVLVGALHSNLAVDSIYCNYFM